MEAAIGQRTAEPLVKEQEQQGDLDALGGELIGVARAVTLEEAVAFELAEIVAELVQPVGAGRELEGGEDGVVDLFGRPAAEGVAAMQQDLEAAGKASARPLALVYILQTAMKNGVPLLPTEEGFYTDSDDDPTPPKIGTAH